VHITGYTDSIGKQVDKISLFKKRANAGMHYPVSTDIAAPH
jgi:outer membrane protein OmpA-like peptidoglycan-associated protein